MITRKDLLVISCLRENARETLTRMSRKIRLPISTIYDRMRFQERDCIVRHTALVDFSRLGYTTRVHIALRAERAARASLESYLRSSPHVNTLSKINNGYDFHIDAVFHHLKDLQSFIENLEDRFSIIEKQIYYVVEDIKREAFLSNPDTLDSFLASPSADDFGAHEK
jgi:DNA-binding Lrp family transcriptional regulator